MLPVKLPYHPSIQATANMTVFGTQEVNYPEIYEKGLKAQKVLKIDTLQALSDSLSDSCFIYRDKLYDLIANYDGTRAYLDKLSVFYRRHSSMTELVNKLYYYDDNTIPIADRVIKLLREKVTEFRTFVQRECRENHYKFLLDTHLFFFYATNSEYVTDKFKVTIIC